MKRLLWLAMFPLMALVVNPLQEFLTALRDWWENY